MRILLTNHYMRDLNGSETWVQTMAMELIRRDHDVSIFTLSKGRAADLMPCPVFTEAPSGPFDMIMVNHFTCLDAINDMDVEGLKVFTSHGPQHPLEQPRPGAHFYVAVSEEVQSNCWNKGFRASVIRNPIDLERFRPFIDVDSKGFNQIQGWEDVLSVVKDAHWMVAEACQKAGLTFTIAHYQQSPIDDMSKVVPHHRIVVGGGRGILEALACNCAAFSLNSIRAASERGIRVFGDGWVTAPDDCEFDYDISDFRKVNCSGRFTSQPWTVNTLAEALKEGVDRYPQAWGRPYIQENNDVRKIADRYLAFVEIAQRKREAVTA